MVFVAVSRDTCNVAKRSVKENAMRTEMQLQLLLMMMTVKIDNSTNELLKQINLSKFFLQKHHKLN